MDINDGIVVVAYQVDDLAVEMIESVQKVGRVLGNRQVATVEDFVARIDDSVLVLDERLIHLLNGLKRAITVLDNVPVIVMQIGDEIAHRFCSSE